ncbi:ABC transporter ATP-binding protein [Paraferrimonas sedimenticola]|uniref:ABC cobalamin uptake system ATPase BtuD n=1 Tax=Paraferrimonas sedimenticola TaxID=375674 RepID=A0AA37W2Q8_9GAMM|nr:ABC transporter ATP-binding protein [Paraferrimonas sedimenticola]GLP98127.1 ABC cobalamin uptake system ATPase BtuD [Paraferrimonas sedimenticola]
MTAPAQTKANNTSKSLSVEDLSWSVAGRRVLDNISFGHQSGEVLGVIGPNGAGKSSLLRCLYSYLKPQQGSIQLFDKALNQYAPSELAQTLAVVLQHNQVESDANLLQWLALGRTPYRSWRASDQAQEMAIIEPLMARLDIGHLAQQSMSSLSGGERQRALIARALVQQPKLLLLDEPSNHLDIGHQIQIMQMIRSLSIGTIACLHDLNLASAYCDRLLILNQGKVHAIGTPAEVLTRDTLRHVFGVNAQISDSSPPYLKYCFPQENRAEDGGREHA